jgi:hypothetical protein
MMIRRIAATGGTTDTRDDSTAVGATGSLMPHLSSMKGQAIAFASLTSSWSMLMIWSSRERNRSCSPLLSALALLHA